MELINLVVALAVIGLALALVWWPVALALALTYSTVVMRNYRGKVRPGDDAHGLY